VNYQSRRLRAVTTIILLALALTGCSGAGDEPAAEPTNLASADVDAIEDTATPTEAEPTITQPPRSQRGNVIMQIGETTYLTMSQTDLTPFVEFQVTEIAVSPSAQAPNHLRTATS
jgi:hypothetical protein